MKVLLLDQIAKVNYKYTFSLANALVDAGNDVSAVIDLKEIDSSIKFNAINLFNTDEKNIGKIKKLKNYIKSYKQICKIIKEKKIEILHTQWFIFSPVDYHYIKKIKRKFGCKIVMTVHDILPFNQKFYDFKYHQKLYSIADEIILQAENNIARFKELFPKLIEKVTMIPHGHFLDYGVIVKKDDARKYLELDQNKTIFLFFGQIKKVKGVGVLLKAFAKVAKDNPNLLLVIAGSVWKDDFSQYQEIIDNSVVKSQIRADIRYIPDEDLKYYFGACDICVLPYLDVYQSGVIQLCYAHNKPVIATNIGAFKEVVIDNETGFLCEANDSDDLAKAMKYSLLKESEFADLAKKGRCFIESKYSWMEICKKINNLYTK